MTTRVILDLGGLEQYAICGTLLRSDWPADRLPTAVAVCAELTPCPRHVPQPAAPRLTTAGTGAGLRSDGPDGEET